MTPLVWIGLGALSTLVLSEASSAPPMKVTELEPPPEPPPRRVPQLTGHRYAALPRPPAPRTPLSKPRGSGLGNVLELPLDQAIEAARLRFCRQPAVLEVLPMKSGIEVVLDGDSDAAVMIPSVYLGWPVTFTSVSSPRKQPAGLRQRRR